MPDPAKTIPAEVRYEIRCMPAPYKFKLRGVVFENQDERDDITVLVAGTIANRLVYGERIVGVICSELRGDPTELLRLHGFLSAGGVIGLNRDIA